MSNAAGAFIISLDFELHWGVFDHTPLDADSRAYFERTRELIPPTLELFARHGIRATWATVGMLFAAGRGELAEYLPPRRPSYRDSGLSAYRLLDTLGDSEAEDPYHFAPSLIMRVADTPGQAIGSHTFAHYYCLEPGQTITQFGADLAATQAIHVEYGGQAHSLVLPRNQYRKDYLAEARRAGFSSYRGNPRQWFWRVRAGRDTTPWQRAVRLLDNYLPVAGRRSTLFDRRGVQEGRDGPCNVPASRFLRPYIPRIDGYGGQRLKLRRIQGEMETAARRGLNYHLWWHPHNLATHPEKNMGALVTLINHYTQLQNKYGWESHSMESYLNQLNPHERWLTT